MGRHKVGPYELIPKSPAPSPEPPAPSPQPRAVAVTIANLTSRAFPLPYPDLWRLGGLIAAFLMVSSQSLLPKLGVAPVSFPMMTMALVIVVALIVMASN